MTEQNNLSVKLPLSPQQKDVFEFIRGYFFANEYAPTFREIQTGVDISNVGLVHKNLHYLEKKGYIIKHDNTPRGIELTKLGQEIKPNKIPVNSKNNENQPTLFRTEV